MNVDLTGEIALVTGASRGIGQGIAQMLGQAGAFVIGTATTTANAERISQSFSEQGIDGIGKVLDIASSESINTLMASLENKVPTILVNNAAITRDSLLMRMNDQDWLDVINANLTSVYRLSKACLRSMMKARHGRIITITSGVALRGNPGQTNYGASKAGVIGFTKSLAREVASRNITVNTIAPGLIETDMTQNLPEEHRTYWLQEIPLHRIGTVNEVASVVVFLASKAAAYITGETIHINGGLYMP